MPVLWSVTFSPAPDTKIGMEKISITMLDAAAMAIDDDDGDDDDDEDDGGITKRLAGVSLSSECFACLLSLKL